MDLSNMIPNTDINGLTLDEDVRSGMNIVDGTEYKKAFTAVSHATAEVLKNTLGPFGRTTVIDDGSSHYITKDGWNIVNRLGFGQPLYNTLYSFIKDASYNLVEKVGDGTTTVIVAADEFIRQMEQDKDFNSFRQRDILNMLHDVKDHVIANLRSIKYLHEIDKDGEFEDIYQIAYTSTNENEEISRMIQKIYQETHNPTIYVNMGVEKESSYAIVNGYQLDCTPKGLEGFINTDDDKYRTTDGVLTFFCNHNMTYVDHYHVVKRLLSVQATLRQKLGHSAPRVILFAPYFDDALASAIEGVARTSVQNHEFPPMMMVQCGMVTQFLKDVFTDAAVVTGSRVFTPNDLEAVLQAESGKDKRGTDLEDPFAAMKEINPEVDPETGKTTDFFIQGFLGNVTKFTASKNSVVFSDFNTELQRYKIRYDEVKRAYEETRKKADKVITMMDKEMLNANLRYVRFSGNMGTITVGGGSEAEMRCLKDSVDDAVLSCRSAYENGYVKGMNLATIGAINDYKMELASEFDKEIVNCKDRKRIDDFKLRITVVGTLEKVFINVTKAVMRNKYPDTADQMTLDWCDRTMNMDQVINLAVRTNMGFNIVKDDFEENTNLQVTNSVICDIEVISACISILSHVLTSNQLLSVNRVYDTTLQNKVKEYRARMSARMMAEEFHEVFKDNLPQYNIALKEYNPEAVLESTDITEDSTTKATPNVSINDLVNRAVDILAETCAPDVASALCEKLADAAHRTNEKISSISKKKTSSTETVDVNAVKKAMDEAGVTMADPNELMNSADHPAEADMYFKSDMDINR